MKKYLFIATLLVPTAGAMADIHFINNTGSQMDYQIGGSYSGCSNSPNGGSFIPTQPGTYSINASTCTNWVSNNEWNSIGSFTVSNNNDLTLTCTSPTACTSTSALTIKPKKKNR